MPERRNPMGKKLQPASGVTFKENKDVVLRLNALEGSEVYAEIGNSEKQAAKFPMIADADGVYTVTIPAGTFAGPQRTTFSVNGVKAFNPAAPMWYYANQLVNYIEFPDPETDALIAERKDIPHGTITHEFIWSDVYSCFKNTLVYLPAGCNPSEEYSLLLLFHEVLENETAWTNASKLNFLFDNMIAEGKCRPFIMVEVDSTVKLDYKSRANWYEGFEKIEAHIINEVLPYIENKYHAGHDKWSRVMSGIGLGAIEGGYIAVRNTDIFGSMGMFTAFWPSVGFDKEGKADPIYDALQELGSHPDRMKVFFHAEGTLDHHFRFMDEENSYYEKLGITKIPGYVYRTYEQTHNWGSYRRGFRDFLPLVF